MCTTERAGGLARRHHWPPTAEVITAWRNFVLRGHDIGRTYALELIDHVDVHRERLVITPKECCRRKELAMLAAIARGTRRIPKEKRELLRARVFSHYRGLVLREQDSNLRPFG